MPWCARSPPDRGAGHIQPHARRNHCCHHLNLEFGVCARFLLDWPNGERGGAFKPDETLPNMVVRESMVVRCFDGTDCCTRLKSQMGSFVVSETGMILVVLELVSTLPRVASYSDGTRIRYPLDVSETCRTPFGNV